MDSLLCGDSIHCEELFGLVENKISGHELFISAQLKWSYSKSRGKITSIRRAVKDIVAFSVWSLIGRKVEKIAVKRGEWKLKKCQF